jgi:hypothetical protein
MKGEAENTIVRIVIALIVIGVIVTLLYLGLGPFRASVEYNACLAYLKQYCAGKNLNELVPTDQGPCNKIDENHQYKQKLDSIKSCADV